MTWTRLDDSWTDSATLANLDFAVRWHYLAMIQFCCRTDGPTGLMRLVDARRVSDHPNPDAAINDLVNAGKLERVGPGNVRLLEIADHVPPEWVTKKRADDAHRKRRSRAHRSGDHSLCIFGSGCSDAPRPPDEVVGHRDMSRDIHDESRDGTGRDGTGSSYAGGNKKQDDPQWNVTPIPGQRASA